MWQYVFPASARSVDPETKKIRRHHIDPTVLPSRPSAKSSSSSRAHSRN
jgi:hypothetical protein